MLRLKHEGEKELERITEYLPKQEYTKGLELVRITHHLQSRTSRQVCINMGSFILRSKDFLPPP